MIAHLNLVQFNCGNANGGKARPVFDALDAREYPILVVQEPGQAEGQPGKTYVPPNYRLGRALEYGRKVAFMVHDKIPLTSWEVVDGTDNVERLRLVTTTGPINIINVYNPPGPATQPMLEKWRDIQNAVDGAGAEEILVLGDFNCHHPEWAGPGVAREPKAEALLQRMGAKGLHNLNEKGVATWARGQSMAVIDLGFGTGRTVDKITEYAPRPEWATMKDHYPISIRIAQEVQRKGGSTRFQIKEVDWEAFILDAKEIVWEGEDPEIAISALQHGIQECLEKHARHARPSDRARPEWSPKAAEYLAGARRARKQMAATQDPENTIQWKSMRNKLRNEMRSNRRAHWRRYVDEATSNEGHPDHPHNKGLWKLSKWGRNTQKTGTTIIPPLRATPQDETQRDNQAKSDLLAQKFFPKLGSADLTDIDPAQQWTRFVVDSEVDHQEISKAIRALPGGKAPGPDTIANEVLKQISSIISEGLARTYTKIFRTGNMPKCLKESLTVTLRKEKKKDYSLPGSYRPIALENTLAKLLEGCLATRMIQAAEERGLLPWNQMGARARRSTLSAIELLTGTIQTAWKAKKAVVTVLGLDLAGAFNNVSPQRLLWILRKMGYPEWIVLMVQSFLTDRRTRIVLADWTSDWISTESGIPQGSTLSPALFLFFISELLGNFDHVKDDLIGFGFVDDMTLATWSNSARKNCRRLEKAHEICEKWAKRHGAEFAPDKYQLIHFTKKKKVTEDLKSTITIRGQQAELLQSMRVLGVWLDPSLSWDSHIKQAAEKGANAFNALARVTSSVWGPAVRKSRLLYTAVVRPIMTYGSPVWSVKADGRGIKGTKTRALEEVQNKCLRRITGAYKRTPVAAIEREVAVPPLDLYIRSLSIQRAVKVADHKVTGEICTALNQVWKAAKQRQRGKRGRAPKELPRHRQPTGIEHAQTIAIRIQNRPQATDLGKRATMQFRSRYPHIDSHFTYLWKERWEKAMTKDGRMRTEATWKTEWTTQPLALYEGLQKHEATALFLLRTEVLGLKAWLARIGVPGARPQCSCGAPRQTLAHAIGYCPDLTDARQRLVMRTGTTRLADLLQTQDTARWAARWLLETQLLDQFRVALEVEEDGMEDWAPFAALH